MFITVEITIKRGEEGGGGKERKENRTIHRYRYGSIVIHSDCGVVVSRS